MTAPATPPYRLLRTVWNEDTQREEVVTAHDSIEILDFGEDGEWLAAQGHHDLTAFIQAADEHARETWGTTAAEELPSNWDNPPRHTYYRPVTLDDCRSDAARYYPDRVAPALLRVAEAMFEERSSEAWVYPCEADYAGAEPWTEVRV